MDTLTSVLRVKAWRLGPGWGGAVGRFAKAPPPVPGVPGALPVPPGLAPGAAGAPGVTRPVAVPFGLAGSCRDMAADAGDAPPSPAELPPTWTTITIAVGTTATAVTAEMAMARSVRRFTGKIQHQIPHR
ncbi:hypothetical protein E1266_04505 [Actinomadura sp. 7K534]|nr:hypothetical protein E1266_04505 [Actinomadura sp. 7K534]